MGELTDDWTIARIKTYRRHIRKRLASSMHGESKPIVASKGGTFYSKRLILSGVYSTTLAHWLTKETRSIGESEYFLERRLDDVKNFGKLFAKNGPSSLAMLCAHNLNEIPDLSRWNAESFSLETVITEQSYQTLHMAF